MTCTAPSAIRTTETTLPMTAGSRPTSAFPVVMSSMRIIDWRRVVRTLCVGRKRSQQDFRHSATSMEACTVSLACIEVLMVPVHSYPPPGCHAAGPHGRVLPLIFTTINWLSDGKDRSRLGGVDH